MTRNHTITTDALGLRGAAFQPLLTICRWQRTVMPVTALFLLMVTSGASCNRQWLGNFRQIGPIAPTVLEPGANRDRIAAAINQNSARVQSLSAPSATITIPGTALPSLRGNLALERPLRFRLTAGMGLTGQEVDVGSNDDLFWVWIRRNQPPGVYLCRHDQFAGSAANQVMPIEPSWLHSALGLVELDPASVYEGPRPRGDGTVELRTYLPSAAGRLHRILVVDATRAWVTEQYVYDATGTHLVASAVAHAHQYDPLTQVSLPQRVTVRLPSADIAFTIDLGMVQINQLGPHAGQLWVLPPFVGYQQFDLGTAPAGTVFPGLSRPAPTSVHAPAPTVVPASATSSVLNPPRRFRPLENLWRRIRPTAPETFTTVRRTTPVRPAGLAEGAGTAQRAAAR